MPIDFEVLAYEDTRLGILCLRRRRTRREPRCWVTEVTLNREFLMSRFRPARDGAVHYAPERTEASSTLANSMRPAWVCRVLVTTTGSVALMRCRPPSITTMVPSSR